jgi:hypothetical protein
MKELKNKTIDELILDIKNLEAQLLTQTEKADALQVQNNEYDKLMGYKPGMTFEEKLQYNTDCENDFKSIEDSLEENSMKREYIEENEIGDRMVDIALEINQLHFDCAELFHSIKEGLTESEYEGYKKHKRNFYALISYFYNIKKENKNEVFDILFKAIRMQKQIYILDEELKGLQA